LHHSTTNTDNILIESLFTNPTAKDSFKKDAVKTIKDDFLEKCHRSAVANNQNKKNIINDVFEKLPMFYRKKGGHYHQMFDENQVAHAMGTLEDKG